MVIRVTVSLGMGGWVVVWLVMVIYEKRLRYMCGCYVSVGVVRVSGW